MCHYELDLDRVKVSSRAIVDQRSFRSKVIVRTHTNTHTASRLLYPTTSTQYGEHNSHGLSLIHI